MIEQTFTFTASADLADRVLYHVCEMSGVNAHLVSGGIAVVVRTPFDASRLDNVENVIRGLVSNVARAP